MPSVPRARATDRSPSVAVERALRVAAAVLVILTATYTTNAVTTDVVGFTLPWDGFVYNAALVLAVVVCAWAGRYQRHPRGWYALATALGCWAAGNLYWTDLVIDVGSAIPYPSLADACWLVFYVPALLGTAWLVRDESGRLSPRAWLDGLVVGLSCAALAAALAVGPILATMEGGPAAVATSVGYLVGNLLLLGLVCACFALRGIGVARHWLWLSAGLVAYAVADVVYAYQMATETYTAGGLLDAGWVIAVALMAIAALDRHEPWTRHRRSPARVMLVPALFAMAALGLLVVGVGAEVNLLATALAAGTLIATAGRAVLAIKDVAALQDESRLEARTDDLTGLANRRSFYERVGARLAALGPAGRSALLLVDLDGFKEINDTLGHQVGDDLLRMVGPRLGLVLREEDVLARLGGDEFAILLADVDEPGARGVAERIRTALQTPFTLEGIDLHVDGSIGIALGPEHGATADLLLQRADIAMYAAKGARSGIEVYLAALDTHGRDHLRRSDELRGALRRGELVLHYQPKWDIAAQRIVGVEALVRWEHPTEGLLLPDRFLPLVEKAGLMSELSREVLRLATTQGRAWLDARAPLPIAVNLSAADFLDELLVEQLAVLLDRSGLPAHLLELEITENTLIADPPRAAEILERLRALGVRVAIDDYGTGYCSLAYLRSLPIDELKLDGQFMQGLVGDPRGAAVVRSTVDLAHSLGMRMVAEGVEDAGTLEALADFGCDIAQGFVLTRALPADELRDWITQTESPTASSAHGGDPV